MSDPFDTKLQLKKRARRRLVGAFAFAGLAAVVLPMVMDEEPKQQLQEVQIRIPSQEQPAYTPKLGKPTAPAPAEKTETAPPPAEKTPEKAPEKQAEKVTEKSLAKAPEKRADSMPPKPGEKPPKAPDVAKASSDPQRAAAILDGKTAVAPVAAATGGQYQILIGAFSNPANVRQLQSKLGELGIKVFTEPLDSPEGKKTRVRAGPFANREAADKALDRMKKIGVSGVIAARQ